MSTKSLQSYHSTTANTDDHQDIPGTLNVEDPTHRDRSVSPGITSSSRPQQHSPQQSALKKSQTCNEVFTLNSDDVESPTELCSSGNHKFQTPETNKLTPELVSRPNCSGVINKSDSWYISETDPRDRQIRESNQDFHDDDILSSGIPAFDSSRGDNVRRDDHASRNPRITFSTSSCEPDDMLVKYHCYDQNITSAFDSKSLSSFSYNENCNKPIRNSMHYGSSNFQLNDLREFDEEKNSNYGNELNTQWLSEPTSDHHMYNLQKEPPISCVTTEMFDNHSNRPHPLSGDWTPRQVPSCLTKNNSSSQFSDRSSLSELSNNSFAETSVILSPQKLEQHLNPQLDPHILPLISGQHSRYFLPPMASNLRPFPKTQTHVSFDPLFVPSSSSRSDDNDKDGFNRKMNKKKSTSMASLVRSRRSAKGKSKSNSMRHKRTFSLNRITASKDGRMRYNKGSREI